MERTPKRTRKRIDILKSAAASFQRRGYHGASVEQIASALNMTKGNLYYYFKNKEEILYVCHEHALEFILTHLSDVEKSDTGVAKDTADAGQAIGARLEKRSAVTTGRCE